MDRRKIQLIGLVILFLLAAAFFVYRVTHLGNEFTIDDKEALAALKWLQLADDGKFDECSRSTVDAGRWFELFRDNRQSLGKLLGRRLKSKTPAENGTCKIVFDSGFRNARRIHETIWISGDAKVWQAKYFYPRRPYPDWRSKDSGSSDDNEKVKAAAEQAIAAMRNLDVAFFDKITLRSQKFRWGKHIVDNIRKQRNITGNPCKYQLAGTFRYTRSFPGRTELEATAAHITCFYEIKGKTCLRHVFLILYKDNSKPRPQWEIYRFGFGRLTTPRTVNRRR
ncbi:MAG: hypothetical protein PHH77_11045 [Victivallaceae bacterium]|nr:hypothetical protein [Victivallaceae bacterium]